MKEQIKQAAQLSQPFTELQAATLIDIMEQNAQEASVIEFTPENWEAEFGESGKIKTPLGIAKMGDNQYLKIIKTGRQAELGMIKPTLTNPDVIIEVPSEAREEQPTERPSTYLFVKTFSVNGKKIRHFESVTVSKEGMEVVISSHIIKPVQLVDRLTKGNILWSRYELHGSDASGKHQGLDGQAAQNPSSNAHGSKFSKQLPFLSAKIQKILLPPNKI